MRYVTTLLLLFLCYFVRAQDQLDQDKFIWGVHDLTKQKVIYEPSYYVIYYPNGKIPSDKGVCTDVIIRAYRKMGIDLQQEGT